MAIRSSLTRKQPETVLRDNIKAAINRTLRARLVVNPVGFDPRARRDYGIGEGSPDLVGVLRNGRTFCIEVKEPTNGRIRRAQAAWWRAARKWNVLGGFARSIDDAIRLLEHAERESSKPRIALRGLEAVRRTAVHALSHSPVDLRDPSALRRVARIARTVLARVA